jgi:SAM-dependent methyltransferase
MRAAFEVHPTTLSPVDDGSGVSSIAARGSRYDATVSAHFSFEVVDAPDYDELRPNYAPEAVDWVAQRAGLVAGSTVVDLAAGTGQLSRAFTRLGVDVVAIEPAANMRAVLGERLGSVRVIDGTAESIPLDDSSVDAVVVGNALHHFDRERAFAEIARILRPGSVLALYWAWPLEERFLRYPGIREIEEVVESIRASSDIATAYRVWSEPPNAAEGFGPFERREFPMTHVIASKRLADLYATSSDVASLPRAARTHLVDTVRELSHGLPETLRLPGRTVVDLCHRN